MRFNPKLLILVVLVLIFQGCEKEKPWQENEKKAFEAAKAIDRPPTKQEAPKKQEAQGPQKADPHDVVRTIKLSGFDPDGEPEIRVFANGNMHVVFNFMPPSFAPEDGELGQYANFDKEMSRAIGLPVLWEDREFFYIKDSRPETIEKIRKFVAGYHAKSK